MSVNATLATWKLSKQQVSATQKLILLALADRAGEDGECWPSLKRIIADTNLDRKTIIENRQLLIEKQLLEYTGEFKGKQKQIPMMRLTYLHSKFMNSINGTSSDNGTDEYFTSPEVGISTGSDIGTGYQFRKRDTEPKRKEPKSKEPITPISKSLSPFSESRYLETYYPSPEPASNQLQTLTPEQQYNVTEAQADTFEQFWSIYPNRKGKPRALAIWFSQGCHLRASEIIHRLCEQLTHDIQFKQGFIPAPAKYLSEERYNDGVFTGKVQNKAPHFNHDDDSWFYERPVPLHGNKTLSQLVEERGYRITR